MNNLYNLIKNFNFYLEAFRNIESNKIFVSDNNLKEDVKHFFRLLSIREKDDIIKDKIKEYYNNVLEALENLSNDQILYGREEAFFSIDLEQKDIEEFKKLYTEMIEDFQETKVDSLVNFIQNNLKTKLFIVILDSNGSLSGFQLYDIMFSNLKSHTNAPENSGEKGLISKNFKIIFGVILGFAEKLNVDFDYSVFSFSGTVEGEKDKDTNRRLKAYHMAHKGFLKMQYNDIDEKELSDAFKNNEIHPFLYRISKDKMYISVSKRVNLTEVFNNDGNIVDDENQEAREEAWTEFVLDYLLSEEGISEIEETYIDLLDGDIQEFIEILFPSEKIWNDLVRNNEFKEIDDKIDYLMDMIQKAVGREISFKDFNDNYEELVNKVKENSLENEILNLMEGYDSNISEIFSLLKDIVEKNRNRINAEFITDILKDKLEDARDIVEKDFAEDNYDSFMDGLFDQLIGL